MQCKSKTSNANPESSTPSKAPFTFLTRYLVSRTSYIPPRTSYIVLRPSFLVLLLTVLSLENCKPKSHLKTEGAPVGFDLFYDRFHADSLYQMAHIRFPLEGLPYQVDSLTYASGTFRWQADKWIMHRPVDTVGFDRSTRVITPTLIIETIKQRSTPYGISRRFMKDGEEWYLIYYSDMNQLK